MIYVPNLVVLKKEKMRSEDRVLVIKPKEGKKPTSGTGLVDSQLFLGGNQLHAIRDPLTTLWYLKYERGVLPTPLKQRWTHFNSLLTYVTNYFNKRNLNITEVID